MERGELEHIRSLESQETPEPSDLRRVCVEGSDGPHSLGQGPVDLRAGPHGLRRQGHEASPSIGHVECATIGTEALAF